MRGGASAPPFSRAQTLAPHHHGFAHMVERVGMAAVRRAAAIRFPRSATNTMTRLSERSAAAVSAATDSASPPPPLTLAAMDGAASPRLAHMPPHTCVPHSGEQAALRQHLLTTAPSPPLELSGGKVTVEEGGGPDASAAGAAAAGDSTAEEMCISSAGASLGGLLATNQLTTNQQATNQLATNQLAMVQADSHDAPDSETSLTMPVKVRAFTAHVQTKPGVWGEGERFGDARCGVLGVLLASVVPTCMKQNVPRAQKRPMS
eukprot:232212-Chlamydomonas_euryale.AAC.1